MAKPSPKETQGEPVKEAWILCLILGLVMINFPFIHIFNTEQTIFAIPVLVLYFLVGWPASICVIWLFVRILKVPSEDTPAQDDKDRTL
jgi:hypothetical protein